MVTGNFLHAIMRTKLFLALVKFYICSFAFASMGGSGAAVIGLRNPDRFQSISLFAPNCNPISWGGDSVFGPLLGKEDTDKATLWILYDTTEVAKRYDGPYRNILVDQVRLRFIIYKINPMELINHECIFLIILFFVGN